MHGNGGITRCARAACTAFRPNPSSLHREPTTQPTAEPAGGNPRRALAFQMFAILADLRPAGVALNELAHRANATDGLPPGDELNVKDDERGGDKPPTRSSTGRARARYAARCPWFLPEKNRNGGARGGQAPRSPRRTGYYTQANRKEEVRYLRRVVCRRPHGGVDLSSAVFRTKLAASRSSPERLALFAIAEVTIRIR